jgi:uncharacterized protein
VTGTALAFIFTWLSNNTKASLLLAILLHGSVDGTATYIYFLAEKGAISQTAATNSAQFGPLITCVVWAVVLAVLTRRRLSYPRYRDEAEQLDLDPSTAEQPAARALEYRS